MAIDEARRGRCLGREGFGNVNSLSLSPATDITLNHLHCNSLLVELMQFDKSILGETLIIVSMELYLVYLYRADSSEELSIDRHTAAVGRAK